ncbi:MAG TPA: glycosyltransferase, partial [Allocoleopsis sp.]
AMARGLPCIGSRVGGIPELLSVDDLVPPNDAPALANKISEVLIDPVRLATMSARSCEQAKQYKREVLRDRRITFYRYLREATEAWLESQRNLLLAQERLPSHLSQSSSTASH